MNQAVDCVIVGAGIAGLTLAYQLKQSGRNYLLIEPGQIGGFINTKILDGFLLECGPNVFVTRPQMLTLLAELGLSSEVVFPRVPKFRQLIWDTDSKQVTDVPRGPLALLKSKALTLIEKFGILKGILKRPILSEQAQDLSVGELFMHLGSKRLVDQFVDGGLKGVYGGDVYKLSARTLFPNLWRHLQRGSSMFSFLKAFSPAKMFMLRNGNSRLVEKLVEKIGDTSTLRDQVNLIQPLPEGGFLTQLTSGASIRSKKLVISTAATTTAKFLGPEFSELSSALQSIPIAPLALMHFEVPFDQKIPQDAFGILHPGVNDTGFLGVMFSSHLFPHMAPLNKQLITVCIGGLGRQDLLQQDDDSLDIMARSELQRILAIKPTRLLSITRWPLAVPQLCVGHFKIESLLQSAETRFPGLKFIGCDRGGVGVSDRIRIALNCEV